VTTHVFEVPLAAQGPVQPVKSDPASGVTVSVMLTFVGYEAAHDEPHVMPGGLLFTVPPPDPALLTVNWVLTSVGSAPLPKTATTWVDCVIVIRQRNNGHDASGPFSSSHRANADPANAIGQRVTFVPAANCALQVSPQSMPWGEVVPASTP